MSKRNKIAIGILLSLIALVGLGVCVWPYFDARNSPATNQCIYYLRQLEGDQQAWALENNRTTNDVPTWDDLTPYLPGGRRPVCPEGGTYSLSRIGDHPKCSLGPPRHVLE